MPVSQSVPEIRRKFIWSIKYLLGCRIDPVDFWKLFQQLVVVFSTKFFSHLANAKMHTPEMKRSSGSHHLLHKFRWLPMTATAALHSNKKRHWGLVQNANSSVLQKLKGKQSKVFKLTHSRFSRDAAWAHPVWWGFWVQETDAEVWMQPTPGNSPTSRWCWSPCRHPAGKRFSRLAQNNNK